MFLFPRFGRFWARLCLTFARECSILKDMNRNKKKHRAEWERVGATLAFVRTQRGVTQEELSNSLEIARPYLANIEAGRRSLTPQLALRAAEILKVRPIVLINSDFLSNDLQEQTK